MAELSSRDVSVGFVNLTPSASTHFNCIIKQLQKESVYTNHVDRSTNDVIRVELTNNSLAFAFHSPNTSKSNDGFPIAEKKYKHTFGNKDFKRFTYKKDIETFASIHRISEVTKYWEPDKTFIFSFTETNDPVLNFNPVCVACRCRDSIHSK